MFTAVLASMLLSQSAPLGIDPAAAGAHLLPVEVQTPPSAAWTWAGAIGGTVAGTSIGLNVGLQTNNALNSSARTSLSTPVLAGSIVVGLATGAVAGYLLGQAAHQNSLLAKIGVWAVWGLVATAATVAAGYYGMAALFTTRSEPKAHPLAQ